MIPVPAGAVCAAVAWWWRHANPSTRQRVREADYYAAGPLSPALVSTLSQAGVELIDAHLHTAPGRLRGYYLPEQAVATLRALDAPGAATS